MKRRKPLLALAWMMGAPPQLRACIGAGSAVIATAPVIEADERDWAFSVATVSFLGLLAMSLLPVAAKLFGMDARSFALWAGGSGDPSDAAASRCRLRLSS